MYWIKLDILLKQKEGNLYNIKITLRSGCPEVQQTNRFFTKEGLVGVKSMHVRKEK